ncbi:MAG: cyclic nucleotide-binding domain-containing protein [Caldilineales bacterium]
MTSQFINRVPLFAGLGSQQLSAVEERFATVQFGAGETIFKAGEPATRMLLIENGYVRLVTDRGVALATLGPGSTLGDQDMLAEQPYASGAQAIGAVSARSLSGRDLEQLVQRDPALGLALSRSAGMPVAAMRTYVLSRLQSVPGWRRVSRAALLDAEQRLTVTDAPAGQRLYSAGDPPSALYILERGQMRLSDPSGAFGDISVGAGAVFGDMELLTGKPAMRTAEAVADATLWTLNAQAFADLTAEYPELRSALSQELRAPLSLEDQKTAIERLRQLPTFSRWPDEVMQQLGAALLLQHVPAGELVYRKGDPGNGMFLVERGQIELHGDDEMLARLTAGNDFGEMALVSGRPRTSNALAATDANLWVLYRSDFERLLSRYPAVQAAVTENVAQRLASADEAFYDRHLRQITLLSGLSRSQIEAVRRRLQAARYRAGEVVFYSGDEPDGLFMVERGQVSVDVPSSTGGMTAVVFSDGDIFGEGALLLDGPRTSTARAVTDLDVWLLRREDFEDLMLQYPSLALNLSRVLENRLRANNLGQTGAPAARSKSSKPATAAAASAAVAASTAKPAARPAQAAPPPAPAPAKTGGLGSRIRGGIDWFQEASTVTKILVVVLLLMLVYICGFALPYMALVRPVSAAEAEIREIQMAAALPALGGVEVPPTPTPELGVLAAALSGQEIAATPTYTPWPTETPIPTDTPTVTPTPTFTATPTDTPEPTATPTFTPEPTNTPVPVRVAEPVVEAQPEPEVRAAAAAVEAPQSSVEWRLVSARRLTPCENRGKHNIFVKVLDAAGNPYDGALVVQSNRGDYGNILDRMPSGTKGPGEAEFIMWKIAEYSVFIANPDGTPASTDFAEPIHSNFTDEAECGDGGGGGNTLFHNSFEVIFQRTS